MLVGEVRSAAAFGTKENPVIAPPALRLTNAVTCCHQGLLAILSWQMLKDKLDGRVARVIRVLK